MPSYGVDVHCDQEKPRKIFNKIEFVPTYMCTYVWKGFVWKMQLYHKGHRVMIKNAFAHFACNRNWLEMHFFVICRNLTNFELVSRDCGLVFWKVFVTSGVAQIGGHEVVEQLVCPATETRPRSGCLAWKGSGADQTGDFSRRADYLQLWVTASSKTFNRYSRA
jgi:hypothetical protein